jgi:hypothetical protein
MLNTLNLNNKINNEILKLNITDCDTINYILNKSKNILFNYNLVNQNLWIFEYFESNRVSIRPYNVFNFVPGVNSQTSNPKYVCFESIRHNIDNFKTVNDFWVRICKMFNQFRNNENDELILNIANRFQDGFINIINSYHRFISRIPLKRSLNNKKNISIKKDKFTEKTKSIEKTKSNEKTKSIEKIKSTKTVNNISSKNTKKNKNNDNKNIKNKIKILKVTYFNKNNSSIYKKSYKMMIIIMNKIKSNRDFNIINELKRNNITLAKILNLNYEFSQLKNDKKILEFNKKINSIKKIVDNIFENNTSDNKSDNIIKKTLYNIISVIEINNLDFNKKEIGIKRKMIQSNEDKLKKMRTVVDKLNNYISINKKSLIDLSNNIKLLKDEDNKLRNKIEDCESNIETKNNNLSYLNNIVNSMYKSQEVISNRINNSLNICNNSSFFGNSTRNGKLDACKICKKSKDDKDFSGFMVCIPCGHIDICFDCFSISKCRSCYDVNCKSQFVGYIRLNV